MEEAVDEIREKRRGKDGDNEDVIDIAISQDGTWQLRGYSSLIGCVAAIAMDNGKVVDVEPMTRFCRGCTHLLKYKTTDPAKYDNWKVKHKCHFNYKGSAGGMEVTGAVRIFNRSIKKRKVRYTTFYVDGDSKAHEHVKDTYPGRKVKKGLQCVGHVQKRVGSRLFALKKRVRGLGGRGKLTKNIIDRLQNYYGKAIRQNVNNLPAMQKAVRATLFLVASKKNNYHSAYCPTGADSWCILQSNKATGENTHKFGPGLPLEVIAEIKPILKDLSSEILLKDCLHGKTQNKNESFNGTVWERLPKSKFNSIVQLKFGVYEVVANFNIGRKASVLIFERMKMRSGQFILKGCRSQNKRRLFHANEVNKKRRKIIRGEKKKKAYDDKVDKGTLYKAGAFN